MQIIQIRFISFSVYISPRFSVKSRSWTQKITIPVSPDLSHVALPKTVSAARNLSQTFLSHSTQNPKLLWIRKWFSNVIKLNNSYGKRWCCEIVLVIWHELWHIWAQQYVITIKTLVSKGLTTRSRANEWKFSIFDKYRFFPPSLPGADERTTKSCFCGDAGLGPRTTHKWPSFRKYLWHARQQTCTLSFIKVRNK